MGGLSGTVKDGMQVQVVEFGRSEDEGDEGEEIDGQGREEDCHRRSVQVQQDGFHQVANGSCSLTIFPSLPKP